MKEVYLIFADAIMFHLDDDAKARAQAAIDEQQRSPQPKTIFNTVHAVMYDH